MPDPKLMEEMIAASKAAGGDTWKTAARVKGVMEPDKSKQPRFMSSEA